MAIGAFREDGMSALEALLVCLCLGSVVATLCVWMFYWVEGMHYADLLGSPWEIARIWLLYALAYSIPGMAGWGMLRVLAGPPTRHSSMFVVLTLCGLPAWIGLAATRPAFLAPSVLAGGLIVLIALLSVLVCATRSGRPRIRHGALIVLIAVPTALTAFNLVAWLRPAEFGEASRVVLAAGICLGAAIVPVPILWAQWSTDPRRRIRWLLGIWVFASILHFGTICVPRLELLAAAAGRAPSGSQAAPSVLLIVADTLRADFVSGFGARRGATPVIASLERDGVSFARAMSAAPWTTPSFASILSSTYPSEHRAGSRDLELGFKHALVDRIPTLPAELRDAGYWTGAVLTNAYLGRRFGLDRGFSAYENILAAEWAHPILVALSQIGWLEIQPFVRAERQTDRVLGLIRRGSRSGRPFFVLAHYMDPHLPYRGRGRDRVPTRARPKPYRDEVAQLDQGIGVLVGELKRSGLYDDTLIVFTADHGEEIGERRGYGDFGHGHTMFDEILRVPLVIKLPRSVRAGERRDDVVSLIDVAPTILELVGREIPSGFRGRSLFGESSESRPVFSERTLYGPERKSVIAGNLKVVLDFDDSGLRKLRGYDLAVDPGERRPVDWNVPPFRGLAREIDAFASRDIEPEESERIELDPRLRQRLEALGYAE